MEDRLSYLADTSALNRLGVRPVADRLEPLIDEGTLATCAIVDLEILYSARSTDYDAVLAERRGFPTILITPEILERSTEIQRMLAQRSQHRLPIPDLIVAASAESAGVPVLHYDAHFDQIAGVTGQAHEWVVPRGSI